MAVPEVAPLHPEVVGVVSVPTSRQISEQQVHSPPTFQHDGRIRGRNHGLFRDLTENEKVLIQRKSIQTLSQVNGMNSTEIEVLRGYRRRLLNRIYARNSRQRKLDKLLKQRRGLVVAAKDQTIPPSSDVHGNTEYEIQAAHLLLALRHAYDDMDPYDADGDTSDSITGASEATEFIAE